VPSTRRRLVDGLASSKLAIVLGVLACGLLAISSLAVPDPRSKDRLPFSESFEVFLDPVQAKFWWFYALVAVFSVYTLNATLGTWRSWSARRAPGSRDRRFWGTVLMHLGLIGALGAHLGAGLTAAVEDTAVVSARPTPVAGRTLVLTAYRPVVNADGSPRTAFAEVEVDGRARTLSYNEPLWFDGFTRWLLLQGAEEATTGARFLVGGEPVDLAPGETAERDTRSLALLYVSVHPTLRSPMARVAVDGGTAQWVPVGAAFGEDLALVGLRTEPVVSVLLRRNVGVPILFASMAVFTLGIVLFLGGRRRVVSPREP